MLQHPTLNEPSSTFLKRKEARSTSRTKLPPLCSRAFRAAQPRKRNAASRLGLSCRPHWSSVHLLLRSHLLTREEAYLIQAVRSFLWSQHCTTNLIGACAAAINLHVPSLIFYLLASPFPSDPDYAANSFNCTCLATIYTVTVDPSPHAAQPHALGFVWLRSHFQHAYESTMLSLIGGHPSLCAAYLCIFMLLCRCLQKESATRDYNG